MSRIEEARLKAEQKLEQSRRDVEERLAEVKAAVETELGVVPKRGYMVLTLLAGAGGFVLGMKGVRRSRSAKRRGRHGK
ncbi:MAG: hypothetical protein QOJ16_3593 [Acidobacteriota bacterium]|jgi:hypothetical protein|nr:hypothetical protein [Acidobacteriota bacterium]